MALFPGMKKRKAQEPFAETTFECRRGDLTIRGTEYKPEGTDLPVAIVCHGFMAWQDMVRHYAGELARMGYCAYCIDFCGGKASRPGGQAGAVLSQQVLTFCQRLLPSGRSCHEIAVKRFHD